MGPYPQMGRPDRGNNGAPSSHLHHRTTDIKATHGHCALSPFSSTLAPSATPARPMGALCLRKWEEPGRADGRLLCISHSCVRAGASPPAGVCAMVLRWWGINPSILTATSWVYTQQPLVPVSGEGDPWRKRFFLCVTGDTGRGGGGRARREGGGDAAWVRGYHAEQVDGGEARARSITHRQTTR